MPLFFLLSGFCLTMGYGKKSYTFYGYCSNDFKTRNFLMGRVARILPVYYFCFFFALPKILLGYCNFPPNMYVYSVGGSVASLFLVQSWILYFGFGPVWLSWTISTLAFFYILASKLLLIRYKQKSGHGIQIRTWDTNPDMGHKSGHFRTRGHFYTTMQKSFH